MESGSTKVAARAAAAYLGRLWPQPKGPAVVVLLYHRVDEVPAVNSVRPDTFARQMAWLDRHRVELPVLGLGEALDRLATGSAPRRAVVVTFDDGHADTFELALPHLLAHGFPATVYVPSALLDLPGRMSREQTRELHSAGIEVGSHSRSHPDLRRCTDAELDVELRGSKADLEDLLGRPVSAFAYPHGHSDQRVQAACRDAGYDSAAAASRGWLVAGRDRFALPRQFIEDFGLGTFAAVARGGLNVLVPADRARAAVARRADRQRQ